MLRTQVLLHCKIRPLALLFNASILFVPHVPLNINDSFIHALFPSYYTLYIQVTHIIISQSIHIYIHTQKGGLTRWGGGPRINTGYATVTLG